MRGRLDPKEPYAAARVFRSAFAVEGVHGLFRWRGDFLQWNGSHYSLRPVEDFRAALYRVLQEQGDNPNRRCVGDLIDALESACLLPAEIDPPSWLPGHQGANPADLVPCANGLLNTRTRALLPPDPRLFATSALSVAYDPGAPEPAEWLQFLASVWPDDAQSIEALQEWFGLVALTAVTRFQKALLIVGPKRSGKGTILRLLQEVAGHANTTSPTLGSLAEHFGKQALIGKRLAIVSDARLSGRTDASAVAETILRITGEDGIDVPRKHREDWSGKLQTRFVICSNELPSMADASAALSSRFVVLSMKRSFYGREDHGLTDRLLGELPGILRWSLDGLDRLRARGYLLQPDSGRELADDLQALTSPVGTFIADECVLDPVAAVEKVALFDSWRAWCQARGIKEPGTLETFSKRLRAAVPALMTKRGGGTGARVQLYAGIRPRSIADPD